MRGIQRFTFVLLSLAACQTRTEGGRPIGLRDTVRLRSPRLRPVDVALAEFRPWMPVGVDTGGRCREDPYRTGQGLRAVSWRTEGEDRRFWEIRVAVDSAGTVRHYFEDRYGNTAGRTMIRIDVGANRGSAENSIPNQPAQVVVGDASTLLHAPTLDTPSVRAARVLERCRTSLDAWGMLASFPESLPPPPEPRPEPRAADIDREWRDSTRGVGYLTSTANLEAFNWFRLAILPLYREPSGRPFARWARGWVYRVGPPGRWLPSRVAGWIATVYDGPVSLVVFDMRPDGWFRFRYAAPSPEDDGTAWAHESHLTLGAVDLKVVTWEYHYLHGTSTRITDSGPHPLYESPDLGSRVVALLADREYGLSPLEIQGDWMRVRVQWPGPWCAQAGDRTAEGWIRWRTPERGPRLGVYMIC